jgi:hypothetical protein
MTDRDSRSLLSFSIGMSIHTHLHLRKGKRDTTGRHETPETTVNDKIRAEINAGHRFGSFAGERPQNFVKW